MMMKAGIITTMYMRKKTRPPPNTAEPFQMLCIKIAIIRPTIGVSIFTAKLLDCLASPSPMPVRLDAPSVAP